MTQVSTTTSRAAAAKPRPNIYTVLCIVAFVALLFAIVTVVVRSNELFGTGNPFKVVSATAGWLITSP